MMRDQGTTLRNAPHSGCRIRSRLVCSCDRPAAGVLVFTECLGEPQQSWGAFEPAVEALELVEGFLRL